MTIRISYACINMTLGKDAVTSHKPKYDTVIKMKSKGVPYLKKIAKQNIDNLLKIIKWNEVHNVRFFRITSELFPRINDKKLRANYPNSKYFQGDISFMKKKLHEIGKYILKHKHRVTFHRSHYCQLGSPNPDVIAESKKEIELYYNIFNYMGLIKKDNTNHDNCVIMHVGGTYEGKQQTLSRFLDTYKSFPIAIQNILVIENDEFQYGLDDLLPYCELNNIPVCFDFFHNSVHDNPTKITKKVMDRIVNTWHNRNNSTPKFHISDQKPGGKRGAHGDRVENFPEELIALNKRKISFDVMVEAKHKELALYDLVKKYDILKGLII